MIKLPLCTQSKRINLPPPKKIGVPPFKNSMIVTPTIILAILKLTYHFHSQKLISLNTVLSVVLQCSGTVFLTTKKQHNDFPNLKTKSVSAFCYNALIFKFVWVINSLKLIVHLIIQRNSHQQHSKITCIV